MTSISWMAIAPELTLTVGAAAVLLIDVQWKPRLRALGWVAAAALAAALGLAVRQWFRVDEILSVTNTTPEELRGAFLPFGQMIVLDHPAVLARLALLVVASLGLASGWGLFARLGRRAAEALALVFLATAGFGLMAASTHLMMTFLGLEVGSIALYVLAGITRERDESDEAALKYFLLGSMASAIFIYGVALVFAGTGSMSVIEIGQFFASTVVTRPAVLLVGLGMLVVGLAFKVSAAPFHSWAPDVYQGAPAGVVGFMAAAAKIGGFAALGRVLFTAFPSLLSTWSPLIVGLATVSILLGSVLAVVQDDVRRVLAYSGVAHAGFILVGLTSGPAGSPALWFYLVVYTVQLVGAFGVVAAVSGTVGGDSRMAAFSGLARTQPVLAAVFSILLLGLAGIPLTSGFIAKLGVFQVAWRGGWEWLVVVAVVASVIAFAFYLRIISAMYMEEPGEARVASPATSVRIALGVAAVVTLLVGILPGPVLDIARDALPL